MLADAGQVHFPANVIGKIHEAFGEIDPDVSVVKRPLRPTDLNYSIGIFAALWEPDDESLEIGRTYPSEPTLGSYQIGIHSLVKHTDEEVALNNNAAFARTLRNILYRDATFRVNLQSLSASDGLATERFKRSRINNQRFMNNEVDGSHVYLSVMDIIIDTETM